MLLKKIKFFLLFLVNRLTLYTGSRIAALRKGKSVNEESPGFMETRHQITSGWSNPRESATENYRRALFGKVEKARQELTAKLAITLAR